MEFIAIDVETANADVASICQIGLAKFSNGKIVEEWSSLLDPEDYFDEVNISIHGIDSQMIAGKPKLPKLASTLNDYFSKNVCVCHTHFDRVAIKKAYSKYGLTLPEITWLDSARVVRRTWKEFSHKGYGLSSVCEKIGYTFKHHDALEDAKAAGFILVAALSESELGIHDWLMRVNQPIDPSRSSTGASIQRSGNPDGDLYGETIVFTGELAMSRSQAADIAAALGCDVAQGVTKKTTILVVGDQDITKLAGHLKSTKHRKAEELARAGLAIRILQESDFVALASSSQSSQIQTYS